MPVSDEALYRAEEGTPLIRSASGDEIVPLPELPEDASLKEKVMALVGGLGFGTNCLALFFSPNPLVFVSSVLGMMISPFAAFQQRKLTQVRALDETNDRMKLEVEQLQQENARLQEQEKKMGASVVHLQQLEDALEDIQSLRGASLKQLEGQLEESKEILRQMDRNFKGDLLQNLMTIIFALDRDGNMILSDEEIDELIQKLEGMQGVQLKEDLLKQRIIENGRSLDGIMEVARNLLSDDVPLEDSIFQFLEETPEDQ